MIGSCATVLHFTLIYFYLSVSFQYFLNAASVGLQEEEEEDSILIKLLAVMTDTPSLRPQQIDSQNISEKLQIIFQVFVDLASSGTNYFLFYCLLIILNIHF